MGDRRDLESSSLVGSGKQQEEEKEAPSPARTQWRKKWRRTLLYVTVVRRLQEPKKPRAPSVHEAAPAEGEEEEEEEEGAGESPLRFLAASKHLILGSRLNIFLACVVFLPFCGQSDAAAFTVASLVLLPLAALLGDATEMVAYHTNETVGGLLNATFGNATEVIVSLFALSKGLVRVVQVSLLGSVVSNMLLVLGCAFVAAGLRQKVARFNVLAATANTNLLLIAVLALTIPAMLHKTAQIDLHQQELFSRFTSVLLLMCYGCYVYFQLGSHSQLFDDQKPPPTTPRGGSHCSPKERSYAALDDSEETAEIVVDDDDDDEEIVVTLSAALTFLGIATVLIALLSEVITGALEGAAVAWGVPSAFVGFVLLPIVGNAAEHATAITMAYRNKVDLAVAVALGSSTQIALFCIPLMVIIAMAFGEPLTLMFGTFETAIMVLSVFIVAAQVSSGKSHWLNGMMLVTCYFINAFAFLFVGGD